MIAIIAGTGALPSALISALMEQGTRPLICAMAGFEPTVPAGLERIDFRLETLGTLLETLKTKGVTDVCFAGAVRRPEVDPAAIDSLTLPLVPRIQQALKPGDDSALRTIIGIFEEHGLTVRAAHEIAPDLLPPSGVLTDTGLTGNAETDAIFAASHVADMGRRDVGQACVVLNSALIAEEGPDGTDAMIRSLNSEGILFKAPKPDQDRRIDLPVIGPDTAQNAAKAGLSGIVIEAGGVMVMHLRTVLDILNANGMFLWVRNT